MIDIKLVRANPDLLRVCFHKRGMADNTDHILEAEQKWRDAETDLQNLQQLKNEMAGLIAKIKDKTSQEFKDALEKANKIKESIHLKQEEVNILREKLDGLLHITPNLLLDDVPIGVDEEDNVLMREWGEHPKFNFEPKEHFEIGENLGLLDFENTAKISGARFATLKGDLARLERALANFMLDMHIKHYNFFEISPPLLVRNQAMFNAGQLPKFADESFASEDFRLIPTSEVSLVNLVQDQIIDKKDLPMRLTAHSNCFRKEAGSAGRDTRGLIRLHQFSKVELVTITTEEDAEKELNHILTAAENILQKLNLPYRIMSLCSGDIGFHSAKTYDLEVWLPGQNKYREISSCSSCTDYQARRLKSRVREEDGNVKFVHTLNGSGLAVGRTIVAILENYQNEDGSVTIPEVLVPYMNGVKRLEIL